MCPTCRAANKSERSVCWNCGGSLAQAPGSEIERLKTEAYIEGWHAGVTAASNIFDRWYRENCITAGATNAIELAQRLFKEANMSPNND